MATFVTSDMRMSCDSIMSIPIQAEVGLDSIANNLSGITLNQNGPSSGSISMTNEEYIWQTFYLPPDYPRGAPDAKLALPQICGFEVCVEIYPGRNVSAGIDWVVDYWHPTQGWTGVAKGTKIGAPKDGPNTWVRVNFGPVDISDFWYRKFRLGICGRNGNPDKFQVPLKFNKHRDGLFIEGEEVPMVPDLSPVPLIDGHTYTLRNRYGTPAMIEMVGKNTALYSEQYGVKSVEFTSPSPYANISVTEYVYANQASTNGIEDDFSAIQNNLPGSVPKYPRTIPTLIPRVIKSGAKTYLADGVTPFLSQGQEVSLRFRILSSAPDTDYDCSGSLYRTVAVSKEPESIRSSIGELEDAFWLSAPNPSKFACESLYLDITSFEDAQTIDHIMIDPVTPGIYMNLYYSNDPVGGIDADTWDALLWTKVPRLFLLRRREDFTLPEPITAKFLKLEFTHLQPVWYNAGTFQLPTKYRKHPKWVMDYYLSIYGHVRAQELSASPTVNVSYNALELAYNYYLDDLRQNSPNLPSTTISSEGVSLLASVLSNEQSVEESEIDPTTLSRIRTSMRPYLTQPSQQGSFDSLLRSIIGPSIDTGNYPTEAAGTGLTGSVTGEVSALDRESLVVDKQFPITSFYIPCRHFYMHSEARFEEERAYFAGIKEVSLTREHYTSVYDQSLYIDSGGDSNNVENDDLYLEDHSYVTYTEI